MNNPYQTFQNELDAIRLLSEQNMQKEKQRFVVRNKQKKQKYVATNS